MDDGILGDGILTSYKSSHAPINSYRQPTMSPSQHDNYHDQFWSRTKLPWERIIVVGGTEGETDGTITTCTFENDPKYSKPGAPEHCVSRFFLSRTDNDRLQQITHFSGSSSFPRSNIEIVRTASAKGHTSNANWRRMCHIKYLLSKADIRDIPFAKTERQLKPTWRLPDCDL